MGLREIVLKELVVKYQENNDPALFARILKRTDRLLLSIIYKYAKQNEHLKKVDGRELYHTAIIGLAMAVKSSKKESGEKIIARIVAYVELQLRTFYPRPKEPGTPPPVVTEYKDDRVDDILDAKATFHKWVEEGVVSQNDYKLMMGKFGEGKTFKRIAKELDMAPGVAKKHAKRVLDRLRRYYRV